VVGHNRPTSQRLAVRAYPDGGGYWRPTTVGIIVTATVTRLARPRLPRALWGSQKLYLAGGRLHATARGALAADRRWTRPFPLALPRDEPTPWLARGALRL
jgi:hypothetical protein